MSDNGEDSAVKKPYPKFAVWLINITAPVSMALCMPEISSLHDAHKK
ncbi:MAG: hypothetical protein LBH60_01555 [Prevotellaceae bacterium]|jgi:hypothetical protein|nr:hypothetical protein [Prevotellaceae bacterium]